LKFGKIILEFCDEKDTLNLFLVNKNIYANLLDFKGLGKILLYKFIYKFNSCLNTIKTLINNDRQKNELLKKEFSIQSDPEIPKIFKKYITEQQICKKIDDYIEKALKHSRLFIMSHSVYTIFDESDQKSFLGSLFGKKPSGPIIKTHDLELQEAEMQKLPDIEKIENLEKLYKSLQTSVSNLVNDQNEVNRWFYNLQLCFCENYIALANLLPISIVFL